MTELGIDARIDQIKAEEQKTAEQFFEGKLSVAEQCHQLAMLWVERIRLQGIRDYAEFYGVNPDQVVVTGAIDGVTTDVDGISPRRILSVKP